MTPEQIEAALNGLENEIETARNAGFPMYNDPYVETIQFVLRLALRFMGEPSEGMVEDGDAADNEPYHRASCKDIFKAMRDRLIEEVRGDR